eukprot:CAMPEP_0196726406 /NCGR_PEP_ID=MMETSP1091-20130531/7687_1 /TAXON_ID=302021 /ORGANISM="Rhodomonas sp., Strain CCMP768" /LENGTH=222 /DNA_ID=CAMNT_0042068841 /DNA_START=83 /DNA_END=751 /DNA_ORIENTATION=+
MSQPKISIRYFDIEGSAEKVRLALKIGGVDFDDERFPFSEWPEEKLKTPYEQVPTMMVDGDQNTQSYAMLRYAGRLSGLYPDDPYQAFKVDQAIELELDIRYWIRTSMEISRNSQLLGFKPDAAEEAKEAQQRSRAEIMKDKLPRNLGYLEDLIAKNPAGWCVGDRMTIADLTWHGFVRWLDLGLLDGIPADVSKKYPKLTEWMQKMYAHPVLAEHYKDKKK